MLLTLNDTYENIDVNNIWKRKNVFYTIS